MAGRIEQMSRLKEILGNRLGLGGGQEDAGALHRAIVSQSRAPGLYTDLGVADTLDGRFEMLCLHGFLILHRLRQEPGGAGDRLGQAVVDTLFLDLDRSLREMGVGDLSVGKRMKKMGQAFYGRAVAYGGALEAPEDAALEAAIRRNVFAGAEPVATVSRRLADYVRMSAALLSRLELAALRAGAVEFAPIGPATGDGRADVPGTVAAAT